jgi:hypothetical protein
MIPLTKVSGSAYEHLFVSESLRRGFLPHIPAGDWLEHDVLLLNRHGGVARIQVKGTSRGNNPGRNVCYTVRVKKSEFDFLAGFVEPLNTWWIIPRSKLTGQTTTLLPATRYAKYRDAWNLLEPGRISILQNMY